jgi:hypothetical protein
MKYLLLFACFLLPLSASVYYAKVEPVQKYSIKANATGKVLDVLEKNEGKISQGKILIHIDDFLNKSELKTSISNLASLEKTLKLTRKNLKNSQEVAKIRQNNYNRIKDLKTKSRVEKDNELISLISAQNQVISLENSLQNLLVSISDLKYKIISLKDTIKNKSIRVHKGYLVYAINVKKGDYVNVGTSLVDAYDVSKGKLTIYLSKEDVVLAKSGKMFLNGKESNIKINKIWDVADKENISAYKAEILIPAPKRFSNLIKVEFK